MNDRLQHRGPDAGGSWISDHAALAHRRLSIIDLSPLGRQPMCDIENEVWITFNGEIYNFLELRRELESSGARFRSNSDTEVIIEAYKKWGVAAVARLNGMFAFAIWDTRTETLLLARDRLGKKPLFYYEHPRGGLSFASEVKSLVEDPMIAREYDEIALMQFLRLGYVLSSRSIYKKVKKLAPAHTLALRRNASPRIERYWDLAKHFKTKSRFSSEHKASERLIELFDDAVRIRLMSDVPLGAFLSGGIDSSAIVASMCTARASSENLTFTAAFQEQSFSELDQARVVSRHLGVSHHERTITPELSEALPRIVYFADEPFADTSMIPMYFLSEFARAKVTVALSGDGADEIFAGYETYTADKLQRLARFLPRGWSRAAASLYQSLAPRNFGKVSTDYKVLHFLKGAENHFMRAHYSWRELMGTSDLERLLRPELRILANEQPPYLDFEQFDQEVAGCAPLDRAMYVDTKTWLADDILVKADRMTMAHSLESRSPFLDYRLVEFAASLPIELKMSGFKKKYLLKQSQRKRLPAETLSRKKSGFNAPIAMWMEGPLRPFIEELREGPLSEYLDPQAVTTMLTDQLRRRADNSFKLFALINLNLWLKQNAQKIRIAA